jgi:pilus assembly protein CpaC
LTAAGGSPNGGVDINNPDQTRQISQIVNLLTIIGEDQVTLKVTVAEVSRSVMKQLGVNLIGSDASSGISWAAISDNIMGLGKPLSNSQLALGTSVLTAFINAMEQAGVMKTLAEPTLTAVSGEKATFQVGGEFNLVSGQSVSQGDQTKGESDTITYDIEKLEYGIGLEFQPVVLSPGRISLKIRTAVSEPTTEGSVGLSTGLKGVPGANMLSIRKRLADTTVELPSGGSMMIAGLVRDDIRQAINGLPGLSKIPVLGTLFRSRDFVRNETELVIIVTPYLARPVERTALAKPDDNFNAASDGAGMFLGRVNRVYGTMRTNRPNGRYHGVVGYIYK